VILSRYRHEDSAGFEQIYSILHFFYIDSLLASHTGFDTLRLQRLRDVQATNLDGESGDELLVAKKSDLGTGIGEVWIYRGGPAFQLDSPTVIIRDTEATDGTSFHITTGDIDGDHKPDLMLSGLYGSTPPRVYRTKFFFSDATSPWSWANRPPDRVIDLDDSVRLLYPFVLYDLDGDGIGDAVATVYGGQQGGAYLYLSSAGKAARSRSYRLGDADVYLKSQQYVATGIDLGYLNDSLRRYQMLSMLAIDPNNPRLLGFSGGEHGPDASYDVVYNPLEDGLVENVFGTPSGAIPDVTGDGWDDLLAANPEYGAFTPAGIAIILAGGPYIPRDSTWLGVRDIAAEGKHDALSLWPNPVHNELNIAWRGDLKRMPQRFEVHDLLGRLIASGTVDAGRGAALWRCADVPAGTYLLTTFDRSGSIIASAMICKQ
jgi:hypothetical protein